MEEVKKANILINVKEGRVEISGTEEFVERNMISAFDFLKQNMNIGYQKNPDVETDVQVVKEDKLISSDTDSLPSITTDDKYIKAGVYHIDSDDEAISILKKIPGSNKAEKMKNIALIVLHIRKGKILGKDIVPICEKHNCYDSANFSSVFKNEKTNIIRKGTGQKWTIELTQPGEEAAIVLLEEMANDRK